MHNIAPLHKHEAEENIRGGVLYSHEESYAWSRNQDRCAGSDAATRTHTQEPERSYPFIYSAGNVNFPNCAPADQRISQTRQGDPDPP